MRISRMITEKDIEVLKDIKTTLFSISCSGNKFVITDEVYKKLQEKIDSLKLIIDKNVLGLNLKSGRNTNARKRVLSK